MRASLRPVLPVAILVLAACVEPLEGTDRGDSGGQSSVSDSGTTVLADGGELVDGGDPIDGGDKADSGDQSDAGNESDAGNPDAGDDCVPTGPEQCNNGIDDDCANGTDCNDPTCGQCVPVPGNFELGIMVDAASSCPAGFDVREAPLFAGLDPGAGCVGTCSCAANPTECQGELFIYSTQAQCQADAALTGGQVYASPIDGTCTTTPVASGNAGGFRLGNWTVNQSCTASGVAAPSAFSWGDESKFCVAAVGQQGCASATACVPVASATDACVMTTGGASCPGQFTDRVTEWFTGLEDTRACGACDCTAQGGSCQFARVSLGSDWVCTDSVHLSMASPKVCSSAYSPPARVTGFPDNPTCSPTSVQTGNIQATGQQTICCQP